MNFNNALAHAVLLASLPLWQACVVNPPPKEQGPLVEENATHPGFSEQWREMKQDEYGRIPRGLRSKWQASDTRTTSNAQTTTGGQGAPLMDSPFMEVSFLGPKSTAATSSSGSTGGRTRALLVDSLDDNRLFAGSISGGLWRSGDSGASWTPVDDGATSLAVSCITQSPFDPNRIYYGTGESVNNTAGISGEGVFLSSDGGHTFNQLASSVLISALDRCWAIEHSRCASEPDTVYVGTDTGLWCTRDGGSSWERTYPAGPIADLLTFSDGSVLIAETGVGLFFSPSGESGTFEPQSLPGTSTGLGRFEIASFPGNENILYCAVGPIGWDQIAGAGCKKFLKSSDCGQTWSLRATPNLGGAYGTYALALGVSPSDPNRIVCAGIQIKRSLDGGVSWKNTYAGHLDMHVFASGSGNTDGFWMGNDGGVYRYNWEKPLNVTSRNGGYHTTQFFGGSYAPAGVMTLAGAQDNGTWRVEAEGSLHTNGGDGTYAHISLQNSNLAYSGQQNGVMYRSTNFDGGPNGPDPIWTKIARPQEMIDELSYHANPYQISESDGDQIYCRTNKGLWRSTDQGLTWNKITGDTEKPFAIGVGRAQSPSVWFGGKSGSFYRVDDAYYAGPNSEIDLAQSLPESVASDYLGSITIHPSTADALFAGFTNLVERPRAWRITDAKSPSPIWTNISGDLPAFLPVNRIEVDPLDPDHVFFAATDFGLYYTVNGGVNWIKEARVPNVAIHEAKLRQSDRTLFLFTHGRGIWHLPLQ